MAQQPHNGDHPRQEQRRDDDDRPGASAAARTPQQDHTPRQEEQAARERREQAAPKARAAAPDPRAEAQQKEAMAASSIGAQIILDYNEDGSIGARGGAGGSIVENTMARDAHLVAMGLDPVAPSGPPPSPAALKARREREERAAKEAADPQYMPAPDGKATRMSSLAAGINAGDLPEPPPTSPPASRA